MRGYPSNRSHLRRARIRHATVRVLRATCGALIRIGTARARAATETGRAFPFAFQHAMHGGNCRRQNSRTSRSGQGFSLERCQGRPRRCWSSITSTARRTRSGRSSRRGSARRSLKHSAASTGRLPLRPTCHGREIGGTTRSRTRSSEQVALDFAKRLTEEGHAITDAEFADLLKHFGPEKTTAIVHTIAYANFQNRILLGAGRHGRVAHCAAARDAVRSGRGQESRSRPAAVGRPEVDQGRAGSPSGRTGTRPAPCDLSAALEKQKAKAPAHAPAGQIGLRETAAARTRIGRTNPLEHDQCRLSARDDASVVCRTVRLLRRVETRSRLHQFGRSGS